MERWWITLAGHIYASDEPRDSANDRELGDKNGIPDPPSTAYTWEPERGKWVLRNSQGNILHEWPRGDDVQLHVSKGEVQRMISLALSSKPAESMEVRPEKVRVSLTIPQIAAVVTLIVSTAGLVIKVYNLEDGLVEMSRKVSSIDKRLAYLEAMRGIFSQPEQQP